MDEDEVEIEVVAGAVVEEPGPQPPTKEYIRELFQDLLEYHETRNKWIFEARAHAAAEHTLQMPQTQHVDVHKLNLWSVRTYLNERLARFLPVPRVRIIPESPYDPAIHKASKIEKAIDSALYWMRRSNDDWGKVVSDVLLCEGGVERWEANTAAAWPKLIRDPETEEDEITKGMPTGNENLTGFEPPEELNKILNKALDARKKARNEYKKTQPFPISRTYVPLEAYYPSPDSDVTEECIEIEFRSVRKVMKNKMFSTEGLARLKASMAESKTFKAYMPILRYCNGEVYAYYGLPEIVGTDNLEESFLKQYVDPQKSKTVGEPVLLYFYAHGVGRPLYNEVGGMHGGWTPGDHSLVVGRIKALMQLDTDIDTLASQGWTALREEMWPTWKITISNDRPASATETDKRIKEIHPETAQDVILFEGEDLQPILPPREHPLFQVTMDWLKEAMAKIGGAPGLSGIHQPGIEGGFQENTLLQQADSQFARIENNIVTGAQNGALLFIDLVRAIGEEVFMRARAKDEKTGQMYFEEISLSPDDLEPRPEVDAIVKAKAVGNDSLAIRNYASAITDIGGPGTAAMTRNTARETFLDIEHPDDEETGVMIERVTDSVKYEVIQNEIKKGFNLEVVKDAIRGVKSFNPEPLLQGDPELAAQAAAFASGQQLPPPPPAPPAPPAPDYPGGIPPGMTEGAAQPVQAAGRAEGIMANDMGAGVTQ